jgi:tetratricopeptide (TPR) repeat protein
VKSRATFAVALTIGLAACATGAESPRSGAYADFLIARAASLNHDYAVSADRYAAALARTPGDAGLRASALSASLSVGDAARARQLAVRAGDDPLARLVRAVLALNSARWEGAARETEAIEGAAADELLARIVLAWARVAQARGDEVALDPSAIAQIRPYGGLFAYQQALAFDYAGRTEEALAAYDVASQSALWLPTAIERHADLLARSGARDRAEALLNQDRNRADPLLAAALVRLRSGGNVAAAPLTPSSGAASGAFGLAVIFLQEGDSARGLATATLASMLDPELDAVWLTFAQEQARLGHLNAARDALAHVRSDSPYYARARSLDAWFVFQSGDQDGGLALAQAAAASGDADALRNWADMLRGAGRHGEAAPLYDRLVETDPSNWRLYFSRGVARERLGRWPEAESDFLRALELSPDQPDTLNYLGYMWVDRGERLNEGLGMIARAVQLRPQSGAIVDSLGWAYFRLGEHERAVDLLERAVELEPADPTLTDHLGDAYWQVGRRTEARYQWRRALTLSPEDPAAIAAKIEAGLNSAQP